MRLPKFLRFAPKLFYIAAVIALFFSVALPLYEYSLLGYSSQFPQDKIQLKVTLARYILRESMDALYLLANGLLLQVLIAIWDRLKPASGDEVAE